MRNIMNEKKIKKDFSTISNFRDKNEKASWMRKKKALELLVESLAPIEEQIMKLSYEKQDIMDQVDKVRKTMIKDCIHPQDYLVHYGNYVKCRFCENRINIKD